MVKKDLNVVTKHYAHWFPIYLFIIQMSGIFFIGLVFLIVLLYMGGYHIMYQEKRGRNLHMLLAPFAFVYLNGQGILLFRLMKNVTTQTVKVFHTLLHTTAFLFGVLAIFAMWNGKETPYNAYTEFQNTPTIYPRPSKYTPVPIFDINHFAGLHCHLGYLTGLSFVLVYSFGVFLYLFEVDIYYKEKCSGVHGFLGTYTLMIAMITSVAGIVTIFNDRTVFWFARYMEYGGEYKVGLFCCVSGLMFSWFILYVILNPRFEWIPVGPI